MLQAIRDGFGRWVVAVILGLIAVSFIFWGVDPFNLVGPNFAAKVNGEEIPLEEFERNYQAEQTQFLNLYRIELDEDIRRELRAQVLERMIGQRALEQRVRERGYRASDARVVEQIMSNSLFQVGGQFSPDAYRGQLALQGLSPASFEELQRRALELRDLQNGVMLSSFVTPAEYRRYVELANQRREIAYALFSVDAFLDRVEVGDDEVAAHYEAHPDAYMTEEAVELEYVELRRSDIAEQIEVSEDELRAYYEQQRERFRSPEERRASHILIAPESGESDDDARARAEELLARIRDGEDFAALAAEHSDDPGSAASGGDLGWIGRGSLDPAFEETLYSLELGEVAGPVRTDFGWHIIRFDEVREGEERTFEEVRDELLTELRNERADDIYFERANRLGDLAFDEYDSLERVAEQLGLAVKRIERFPRSGDRSAFPNSAPVVDVVFGFEPLDIGINSELIELSDEHVVVVRVVDRFEPERRPLEEVADEIRETLERERAEQLADEAAAAFAAALPETLTAEFLGASTDASDSSATHDADAAAEEADGDAQSDDSPAARLAAEHGGMWHGPVKILRSDANVPSEIVAAAFGLSAPAEGEYVRRDVKMAAGDRALVVLAKVEPGNPDEVTLDRRSAVQQQLLRANANGELGGYVTAVRQQADVSVPPNVLDSY